MVTTDAWPDTPVRPPPRRRTGRSLRSTSVAAALLILGSGLLTACIGGPPREWRRLQAAGYQIEPISGAAYQHMIYRRTSGDSTSLLHVYIEHDGQPWIDGGRRPARDPTPRHPVMRTLMQRDSGPHLFLGRPCYDGLVNSEHCEARVWTHARYSEEVVESMAMALRAEIARSGARAVRLFGHSGGGTLAVLLAYRVAQVRSVVTLAANLSVAQWAQLHGYSPLNGSLDPMTMPALPGSIEQIHYVGEVDGNTPPRLAEAYARAHPGAVVRVVARTDHLCCWEQLWPSLLGALPRAVTAAQ